MLLAACGSNESERAKKADASPEYSVPDWANPVLAEGKDELPGVKIATFDETPLKVDVYQLRSPDPEALKTPNGDMYVLNYVATNTGKTPIDLTTDPFRVKPTGVTKDGNSDTKSLSVELGSFAGLSQYSEQDVETYNKLMDRSGLNTEIVNDTGAKAHEKRLKHDDAVDVTETARINDQILTLEPDQSIAYGEAFFYDHNKPIHLELSYDVHDLYDDVVLPKKSELASTDSDETSDQINEPDWATPVSREGSKLMALEGNPFNIDVYVVDVVKAPTDSSDSDGRRGPPTVREGDDVMLMNVVITNTGSDTQISSTSPSLNVRYPKLKNHAAGSWTLTENLVEFFDDRGLHTKATEKQAKPYRLATGESYSYSNMVRFVEGEKLELSVGVNSLESGKKVKTLALEEEAKKLQEQGSSE